nr:WAT1-related protein At2g39510-like isoform X2 [Ipomoea batatas]
MMCNERVVKWLNNDAKPYLGVVFLQVTSAGSAILSKAALNQGMNPFTFSFYRNAIAAVIFAPFALFLERLEKVKIKSLHSQAKIVGTASAIGGAMIMTLVKGPIILLPWTKHSNHVVFHSAQHVMNQHSDPIKATLLLAGSCISTAIFIILQGLVRSGAVYYIYGIIMKVKGPVFVTAFNPLSMVLVAIIGSFVLSEKLYMGRVLGAVIVLVGLYLVIWGKSNDQTSPDNNDQNHALPIDNKQPQVVQGVNKDITVSLN